MKTNLHERLIEARENLNKLDSVRCRMAHERVLIDSDSNLPIAGIAPDMEFQRRDLCAAAKINSNLSCSHSMARYPMAEAIEILAETGDFADWRDEFYDINTTIHRLDHEKGEAEKQAARVIKKLSETEEIENLIEEQSLINTRIAEIERRHSRCATKVETLKTKILNALNSAIRSRKN